MTVVTQRGFGIIEIMIALALGVIIMLGVTEVATNNSLVRQELEKTGRQIESAAYALRLLESDMMNAGFFGEMGERSLLPDVPVICPDDEGVPQDITDGELDVALGYPLLGGNGDFTCDGTNIDVKDGTDFIALRRANSCALDSPGCEAAGGNFHIQIHSCFVPGNEYKPFGFLPTPGIDYVISTDTVTGPFGDMKYKRRAANCETSTDWAPRYRLLNRIYFINEDDQLVRAELVQKGYEQTPLVDGVEWMRIEYGIDENADGLIEPDDDNNLYITDPNEPQWPNVAAARISLVVRNLDSSGYTDDRTYTVAGENYTVPAEFENHRRQVYVRTVSLRNIAGRRQD